MKRAVCRSLLVAVLIGSGALVACGNESDSGSAVPAETGGTAQTSDEPAGSTDGDGPAAGTIGVVSVAPTEAAAVIDGASDDLVILDVRTPEEFAEGHLDGALMLDFYEPDFANQLAALDRDVPYVLYCRSGNRSGQVLPVMDELGFTAVTEIAGGIVAWQADGLPVTTD
jgi:rhodanese-related sulfurtransferase